jgi:hypothetical protein
MKTHFLLIFILPLTVLSESCPSFTCDDWVTDICLYHYKDVLIYSNCSNPNMTCPPITQYTKSEVKCVASSNSPTTSSILECVDYKELNELQTNNTFCKPGLMTNASNICIEAPLKYQPCESRCGVGLVCNNSLCIPYFSITAGLPADNSLACSSGILLNKTCQEASVSKSIPQSCRTDRMCGDTMNKNFSTCVCTKNDKPRQICSLHSSDELVIEAKKAASDGDIHKMRLLWHRVLHFPYLEYSHPCLASVGEEQKKLEKYLRESEECSAISLKGSLLAGLIVFCLS